MKDRKPDDPNPMPPKAGYERSVANYNARMAERAERSARERDPVWKREEEQAAWRRWEEEAAWEAAWARAYAGAAEQETAVPRLSDEQIREIMNPVT